MMPQNLNTEHQIRANQYFLLLHSAACLAVKQQILILYNLWFDPINAQTHDLLHSMNIVYCQFEFKSSRTFKIVPLFHVNFPLPFIRQLTPTLKDDY
jgi:hypothetical protein